ncbi:uncharacterized protein LOC134403471 [Elgaria multicarinata webbii]|uniref:uncharacterized protein LOC134403471 n=1 Tax=Elgaria multicarinata webbii TaxID=159646 RepID=UPI002FCCEF2D
MLVPRRTPRTMRHCLCLLFMATLPALLANKVPNVALSGEAFQSSTYNILGVARNAIDGSTSGEFGDGSCSHTDSENNPWLIVDLKAEYRIFHVSITNRKDCCEYRLNGAEIRIGNSTEAGGTTNPRCATITSLGPGETHSFYCEGSQGQFVTINQPRGGYLTLCEVEVFGLKTDSTIERSPEQSKLSKPQQELERGEQVQMSVPNVAHEGRASQSSTFNELGNPENAIDGLPSDDYLRGHCTHTKLELNPWWRLDLTSEFRVSSVSITNRGDCCEERINGAEIRIGNSPEKGGITNPMCGKISSLGPGKTAIFECRKMEGQYITITIPGIRILSLCEVQVFGGVKMESSFSNVAPEGRASQSSTYNELGNPENAIDGSPSDNYLLGHCTHTQQELNPWWRLDLTSEFRVSSVSITNRGDCCEEQINGAEIRIGNSPEKGGITNPMCGNINSLGPGKTATFDCGEMQGQYVTVTIPGMRFLSLCEVQVFGVKVVSSFSNVAPEGRASQSSTYNELGNPENAIDGSPSDNYLLGHCTHTQQELNPWWRLDLTSEFRVSSVSITNRGDCCEERINGAEIRIGNSPEKDGITNPMCGKISSLGPGKTATFVCGEMQGQYVTVTIPGMRILSLCEVQVFGVKVVSSLSNVALNGKAFQSSTYNELGSPENAIDGSTSADYLRGQCTHTQQETDPWWMVNLRARFQGLSVIVTNRGDCCAERIEGAEIRIGDSKDGAGLENPRCVTIHSLGLGETQKFDCEGMQGQYVTIVVPGSDKYLSLCEVQVFGTQIIPLVPNVALKGTAFQSSTYNKLGAAENAIDGSTAVDYMRRSCTHTDLELNPWWTVDLKAEFNVTSVSITNREDCCEHRLNGAEIRIGNSLEKGGSTNPRCATIISLDAGESHNFDCKGIKGQYVTVTIPDTQFLTLCEVQVFGVRAESSGDPDIFA